MTVYCTTCHCSHPAWTRMSDGKIVCGKCGTRQRQQNIIPLNAHLIPRSKTRKETPDSLLHIVR